ncbi:FAD:protein FMN transferase [Amycolatopsis sp. NPDC023774]|uniref:FAD:protein FMN transferase n=1 Tax=Amycolatopsis sp. NPDC023774 TaxID=3155015 RepID=UPI003410403C
MTGPDRRAWARFIMGMPIGLHLRGRGVRTGPAAESVAAEVLSHLGTIGGLFRLHRPGSEVNRIRRGELPPGDRRPWVREVARLCVEARERTDCWFDADLPGGHAPSGLVKGWAAQTAAALLDRLPDHDYCLNAGGDVVVAVRGPDSAAWRVGVEDPRDRGGLLAARTVRAGGVATSGTAARGHHIIDTRTGVPARALMSATVVGASLLWADVYATAAVARGGNVERWVRARAPGHEACAVVRCP